MACPIDIVFVAYTLPTSIMSWNMPVSYLTITKTTDAPQCVPISSTVPATASDAALIGLQGDQGANY